MLLLPNSCLATAYRQLGNGRRNEQFAIRSPELDHCGSVLCRDEIAIEVRLILLGFSNHKLLEVAEGNRTSRLKLPSEATSVMSLLITTGQPCSVDGVPSV